MGWGASSWASSGPAQVGFAAGAANTVSPLGGSQLPADPCSPGMAFVGRCRWMWAQRAGWEMCSLGLLVLCPSLEAEQSVQAFAYKS